MNVRSGGDGRLEYLSSMVPWSSFLFLLTTFYVSFESAYHRTVAANMVQEGYYGVMASLLE
jgi:hypothetical protein